MSALDDLNTVVRVMYATGGEAQLALVVAACEAPQFMLRTADGREFWWRQELCRGAKDSDELRYWQDRARNAERELEQAAKKPPRIEPDQPWPRA